MKEANTQHTQLFFFFLMLWSLVACASIVQARDATFAWTANSEQVDGYRLYYKTGETGGSPYNGTGITEGNSPVETGNVTTFTLHGLSDTDTYHFVLTAVTGELESEYSTELALETLPDTTPAGITAIFSWLPNQESNLTGYKIHYGTASGNYDTTVDIGNPALINGRVRGKVEGLSEGITYYFAATAYDTGNVESDFSTEVVWMATSGSGDTNPPTAHNSEISTSEDHAVAGTLTADNDSGLPINYLLQQDVSHGTLFLETETGHFTYTPSANFAGVDSFTFLAKNNNGDSNTATVSITINLVNDAPTAQNGSIRVDEDSSASGQLHAADPDGNTLTYTVVANPTKGVLTLNNSGAFTYTPNSNATGTDGFTFQARDGQLASNTATVSITINPVNDAPTAQNGSIRVDEDSSASGQLHAADPDGNTLTYTVVANPTKGVLTLNNSGAFTYTPNSNATGTDEFTFQARDGQLASNTATVSITINPVNDAPVAQNGTLNATSGQTTSGILHASDPENNTLTYTLISDPQHVVTISNSTTGSYTFTPVDSMDSPYSFTFTASDGTSTSNTATVTVTLMETNTVTAIFGDTPDSTYPGTLADTYTNLNDNINASAEQIITWSWSSPTPHKPANTIIIKADLSNLPENIEIIDAKLSLYQTSSHGENAYTNSIHKITGKNPIIDQVNGYNAYNGEPWTPVQPGTTFNDIPLGLADIAEPEDIISLGTATGYQNWLITKMIKDWINNPTDNFGLLITGVPTEQGTGRIFASSENQNASIRPKLVIHYTKKPPKPTIISIRKIK